MMQDSLLAYFSEDYGEEDVSALRQMVEALAHKRKWTLGPPQFVDESDASSCSDPEDEPIRTVGALLAVAKPEERPGTPREEAAAFIDALAEFSGERGIELEVELGQIYAGRIRAGIPNRLIQEALLAKW